MRLARRVSEGYVAWEAGLRVGVSRGICEPGAGDAFFCVVSGRVRVHYGDGVSCGMCEGDSRYFDGFVPHRWENGGEEDAVLVLCGDMPSV